MKKNTEIIPQTTFNMKPKKIDYKPFEIQEVYVDQEVRDDYILDVEIIEAFINGEMRKVIEEQGLSFKLSLVSRLSSIKDAALAVVDELKQQYIKKLSFVPPKELERIDANFKDMASKLQPIGNKLFKYVSQHPLPLIQQKNGTIRFDPEAVQNTLNKIGIRVFTDEEVEYLKLLDAAASAIAAARNYEIDHNYIEYSTLALVFAGGIFSGMNKVGLVGDVEAGRNILKLFSKRSSLKKLT